MKLSKRIPGSALDIGGMGVFFWGTISEKSAFCLLAPTKQKSFLTISNENIFLRTKGTRLGAIVTPNKGSE